jgi:hypothetical protein
MKNGLESRAERWPGKTRNWSVVGEVKLNPKDHKQSPEKIVA